MAYPDLEKLLVLHATRKQLVVPESLKPVVYKHVHEEMGHVGADRMVALAREHFFWPKIRQEMEHYVTKVCRCIKRKTKLSNQTSYTEYRDFCTI